MIMPSSDHATQWAPPEIQLDRGDRRGDVSGENCTRSESRQPGYAARRRRERGDSAHARFPELVNNVVRLIREPEKIAELVT